MKKIVVVWIENEGDKMYGGEMRVMYSNHERFVKGTRFDFGFMRIAMAEGFIIEVLP
jgi:hypothetical protein